MKEIWIDIPGYEGMYQASNRGNIRSLDRLVKHVCGMRKEKGRILKQRLLRSYMSASLRKNGKLKCCFAHRLIALAFLPNPDGLKEVNHKDECKTNNNVRNLEWCSHSYNISYGTARKRSAEKTRKGVIATDESGNEYYFDSVHSASGIAGNHISECCSGKRKKCGGFSWRYAEEAIV